MSNHLRKMAERLGFEDKNEDLSAPLLDVDEQNSGNFSKSGTSNKSSKLNFGNIFGNNSKKGKVSEENELDEINLEEMDDEMMEKLRKEEMMVYKELEARKVLEDEDRKVAQRINLYNSNNTNASVGSANAIKIKVPADKRSGDIIKVQIPGMGIQNVQIPPGVKANDIFTIDLPSNAPAIINNRSSYPTRNNAPVDINFLQDSEIIQLMSDSEKEFYRNLPDDLKEDVINEKRMFLISQMNTQPQQDINMNNWVNMVQVTVPANLKAGDKFRVLMPDKTSQIVQIPEGIKSGDTFGIPFKASDVNLIPKPVEISDEDLGKIDFLNSLPDDLKQEQLDGDPKLKELYQRINMQRLREEKLRSEAGMGPEADQEGTGNQNNESTERRFETDDLIQLDDFESSTINRGNKAAANKLDFGLDEIQQSEAENEIPVVARVVTENIRTSDKEGNVERHDDVPQDGIISKDSHNDVATESDKPKLMSSESDLKSPLERLREARLKMERNEISSEEFNRIKAEVINSL